MKAYFITNRLVCGIRMTDENGKVGWEGTLAQWQRVAELDKMTRDLFNKKGDSWFKTLWNLWR